MQRGTEIPQQASTAEDQIPYFRGSRTAPPRAVTEPILYQGSPYGLVVVARDTERKQTLGVQTGGWPGWLRFPISSQGCPRGNRRRDLSHFPGQRLHLSDEKSPLLPQRLGTCQKSQWVNCKEQEVVARRRMHRPYPWRWQVLKFSTSSFYHEREVNALQVRSSGQSNANGQAESPPPGS